MLTDEQRKKRQKGIGGSDVSIIFGLSSYKTPYALFLEKLGLLEPVFEETPQQEWGHILEDVVRQYFIKKHGVTIQQPDTLVHPMFDFMLANLDGYIVEWDCVHEIKCSDRFMAKEWGEDGSDYIPLPYLLQVAHYVSIKGTDKAVISVLIGGNEYREFTYHRDRGLEAEILSGCSDFWDCVKNETPPEPINIDDLKLRYRDPNEIQGFIEANSEILVYCDHLNQAKSQLKELKEIEEQHKFQIMSYMAHNECLTDSFGKPVATWKMNKKGSRTFLLKGGK